MDRLLQLMCGASLVLLVLVLVSVRRSHIRVEYSVSWLIGAVALLLLSQADGVLNLTAQTLGVYGPLMVLLVIGCVFLIMFFRFSIIVSKLRDDNIALAQKVAILEYHLRNLRDERTTASPQ